MTMDTVRATARFIGAGGYEHFFIGGGEPTLHPKFWDIVDIVKDCNADWAEENGCPPVQLVTNGSKTKTVMRLVEMADKDEASVRLSRDQFHLKYPIDPSVIAAFPKHPHLSIGSYIHNVVNTGRAQRSVWAANPRPGCDACGPVVTPNGKIWRCACRKECIGDVFRGYDCDSEIYFDGGIGCTIRDGKLIRDPRSNLLRHRHEMEAEGWIFNPNVFKGQLEFDLNSELFKDTHHGTYDSTRTPGSDPEVNVDGTDTDASAGEPVPASVQGVRAALLEGDTVCATGSVGTQVAIA